MSIHPLVCADAALAASQNVQVVELHFEGAALGANGTILQLVSAQRSASARAHLAVGNGTSATATPSSAAVEALIKRPNGNSLSATEVSIRTGVLSYLGDVAALSGANSKSVAFAIGGLNVRDVQHVELIVGTGSTKLASRISNSDAAARIPEPVDLVVSGSKSYLKKADGSAATPATDTVVLVGGSVNGSASTLMCVFTVPAAADFELAAGKRLTVRLHCSH